MKEGAGGIKQKCAAICSDFLLPAVACRIATMRQIHTLSRRTSWGVVAVGELWCRRNEDTKVTRRTVNNKELYNSRDDSCSVAEEHTVQQKQRGDVVILRGEKHLSSYLEPLALP